VKTFLLCISMLLIGAMGGFFGGGTLGYHLAVLDQQNKVDRARKTSLYCLEVLEQCGVILTELREETPCRVRNL